MPNRKELHKKPAPSDRKPPPVVEDVAGEIICGMKVASCFCILPPHKDDVHVCACLGSWHGTKDEEIIGKPILMPEGRDPDEVLAEWLWMSEEEE